MKTAGAREIRFAAPCILCRIVFPKCVETKSVDNSCPHITFAIDGKTHLNSAAVGKSFFRSSVSSRLIIRPELRWWHCLRPHKPCFRSQKTWHLFSLIRILFYGLPVIGNRVVFEKIIVIDFTLRWKPGTQTMYPLSPIANPTDRSRPWPGKSVFRIQIPIGLPLTSALGCIVGIIFPKSLTPGACTDVCFSSYGKSH